MCCNATCGAENHNSGGKCVVSTIMPFRIIFCRDSEVQSRMEAMNSYLQENSKKKNW